MRPTVTLLGAIAVAVLVAHAVVSPARAHADDEAISRFHFERALRHYDRERYEEAARELFEAQRLTPSPRIVYNLALCFLMLERRDDAFLFFREYLDGADDAPGAAERRAFAEQKLAEVMPSLAVLAVRTVPEGASIYVDREELGSFGVAPRSVAVAPGEHVVIARLPGHRAASTRVTAVRGEEVALELRPEPILGALEVRSRLSGTVVVRRSDGVVVGEGDAPLALRLPPAVYGIEVVVPGHRPFLARAEVVEDGTASVEAAPEELPPATGRLMITANVPRAEVVVDGRVVGFTPLVTELPIGEHALHVQAPGHLPARDTLGISEDGGVWLTVDLARRDRARRRWAFALDGSGAALLAMGAIAGGLQVADARSLREDRRSELPVDARPLHRRARRRGRIATGTLLTGTLCASVGLVLTFGVRGGRSTVRHEEVP